MRPRTWIVIVAAAIVVAGAIALIVVNPGGPVSVSTTRSNIKNPETYVTATTGDVETLDPAWHYDTASAEAIFNVYEPLIFYDREYIDKFVPLLATSVPTRENGLIRTEPDGRTSITFPIRKRVKFHEGPVKDANGNVIAKSGELTPSDVAYTIQRGLLQDRAGGPQWVLIEPLLGSPSIDALAKEKGEREACELAQQAVQADEAKGTVTFRLVEPFLPILQILAGTWGAILDREWVVALGGWDGTCENWRKWHDPPVEKSELFNRMNGTGPYKLERWLPNEEIAYVRNERYWRSPAAIRRVVTKVVTEWTTRLSMLEVGDADYVTVPRQYIDQVQPFVDNNLVRVYKDLPTVSMDAVFFNQSVVAEGNVYIGSGQLDGKGIPPDLFRDIHARRAFAYSFDWDAFIQEALKGEAEQARGPIIRGVFGHNPEQPTYRLDREQAVEHFKQAWGGRIWDLGFKMTILYNSGNVTRKTAAEIIERNVEQLNPKFQIDVRDVPWPTFLQEYQAGRLPLFVLGWLEDFHDPHNWAHPFLFSRGAYAGFMNLQAELQQRLDELVDQARRELDPEKRRQLYYELQRIAHDEAVSIYLTQPLGRRYERTWLKGWYYNPAFPGDYFYVLRKG